MRSHHASAALSLRCTLGCAVCCWFWSPPGTPHPPCAKVGRVERGQTVFLHIAQPGKGVAVVVYKGKPASRCSSGINRSANLNTSEVPEVPQNWCPLPASSKRRQQSLVRNQPRRHHHEQAGKARIVPPSAGGVFVQQLPDQQRLQYPGFTRAGGHLENSWVRVFGRRHLRQPVPRQQRIGRYMLVQGQQRGRTQHQCATMAFRMACFLPGMKIQPAARRRHVFAKPPPPQQLGGAMFKPQRQRVGAGGKAAERARGNSLFKAMRQSGSAYNCGNSRKECNVHHFCSHRRALVDAARAAAKAEFRTVQGRSSSGPRWAGPRWTTPICPPPSLPKA